MHQTAVALNVGGKNCNQLPLDRLLVFAVNYTSPFPSQMPRPPHAVMELDYPRRVLWMLCAPREHSHENRKLAIADVTCKVHRSEFRIRTG
jgi:hypothetical protein